MVAETSISAHAEVGKVAMKRVSRRILPLVFLGAFMNNLSQGNISLAASGMMEGLGINERVFGISVSLFFIPAIVLQIPLVQLAKKFGARRSFAGMSFIFGVVSASTCTVTNVAGLVAIRLVQGAVQAPFLPYATSYISTFYSTDGVGKAFGLSINLGISLSSIIPLGAAVLYATSASTVMASWRWLFLIEALPYFILTLPFLFLLPDGPSSCGNFLRADEQQWMIEKEAVMEADRATQSSKLTKKERPVLLSLLLDVRIGVLIVDFFFHATAYSGFFFFLPSILSNDNRYSEGTTALLSTIPFAVSVPLGLINAAIVDRTGKRLPHAIFGQMVALVGMLMTALILRMDKPPTSLELISLSLIETGSCCFFVPFITFPGEILPERVASTGFAVISMGGSTGFAIGPSIVGALAEAVGSYSLSFIALASIMSVALSLTISLLVMTGQKKVVQKTLALEMVYSAVPVQDGDTITKHDHSETVVP